MIRPDPLLGRGAGFAIGKENTQVMCVPLSALSLGPSVSRRHGEAVQ